MAYRCTFFILYDIFSLLKQLTKAICMVQVSINTANKAENSACLITLTDTIIFQMHKKVATNWVRSFNTLVLRYF